MTMKKLVFLLLTLSLMTSCVSVKNSINRASVEMDEPFTKCGVEGRPDGVEVYKGHECLMTPAEIKRLERDKRKAKKKQEREKKKSDKALEKAVQDFSDNYEG